MLIYLFTFFKRSVFDLILIEVSPHLNECSRKSAYHFLFRSFGNSALTFIQIKRFRFSQLMSALVFILSGLKHLCSRWKIIEMYLFQLALETAWRQRADFCLVADNQLFSHVCTFSMFRML